MALRKLLENLRGAGSQCSVHVKCEREELESTLLCWQSVPSEKCVATPLTPHEVVRCDTELYWHMIK
jgi:hypothetical protein